MLMIALNVHVSATAVVGTCDNHRFRHGLMDEWMDEWMDGMGWMDVWIGISEDGECCAFFVSSAVSVVDGEGVYLLYA